MDQKTVRSKFLFMPPPLAVTGTPIRIRYLSESKSKINLVSPKLSRGPSIPLNQTRLNKTMQSSMPSVSTTTSSIRVSTALLKTLSKTTPAKSFINTAQELESSGRIYKCMSNPNVNANPSIFGHPVRATTALVENSIIYKTTLPVRKRKSTGSKGSLAKSMIRSENLIINLQKSNGFICKNEEKTTFKYFVGSGNNSQLICQVMGSRSNWKKSYSHIGAHFIWTSNRLNYMYDYLNKCEPTEGKSYEVAVSEFPLILPQEHYCHIMPQRSFPVSKARLYNRLLENFHLTSKKRLFYNMHSYYSSINVDPFTKIPLTFHISYGSYDSAFKIFVKKYNELKKTNPLSIWIVKPGECTNRGFGIRVCSTLEQIIDCINNYDCDYERTFIIQKYIEKPLLYKNRKFDIRCYALFTSFQGNIQCFFYKEGYMRTSCAEYSLKNIENKYIHLTNDAVQKSATGYGKHEAGNKLSYMEFQEYLSKTYENIDFYQKILPQMKQLVKDTAIATYNKIDPWKRNHSFEILGYDFMIDDEFGVWLIEVNTNPCLELSSPYLEILIPRMLQQAFELTVDQIFPYEVPMMNEFEMVFNEASLLRGQF